MTPANTEAFGDDSDNGQGEDKDNGKHKGKDKNKNKCEDNDGNKGNALFSDLDNDHSEKFTSSGNNSTPRVSASTVATPEPTSVVLLFFGLASVHFLRRKRWGGKLP